MEADATTTYLFGQYFALDCDLVAALDMDAKLLVRITKTHEGAMLRNITTAEIKQHCGKILKAYNYLCKSIFSRPGKEGIDRKVEFMQLVSKLNKQSPKEAFVLLYQFYCQHNTRSRLLVLLRELLTRLVGVEIPRYIASPHGGNFAAVQQAYDLFERKAKQICDEYGVDPYDKSQFLLTSM